MRSPCRTDGEGRCATGKKHTGVGVKCRRGCLVLEAFQSKMIGAFFIIHAMDISAMDNHYVGTPLSEDD